MAVVTQPRRTGRKRASIAFATALVAVAFSVVACAPAASTSSGEAAACAGDTPSYRPYRPLMAQSCAQGPLFVTGSQGVAPEALREAGRQLQVMLQHRPDVANRLRMAGAVTAVFSPRENVCDLDYFSDLRGREVCLSAQGGLGGVRGRPATGCSERNLLSHITDPFRRWMASGENVCVHELAHTIMNVGLSDDERAQILTRFEQVKAHPTLWRNSRGVETYALRNDHEFWAEASQSYFHANPNVEVFEHNGINGPDALRSYDPATFALVDSIYRGSADLR